MDYNSLTAAKGTAGSITDWVGYSKMDAPTLLDWAQSLIYTFLRTREMRKSWTFGVSVGQSSVSPLPTRFLDPISPIEDITNQLEYQQLIPTKVQGRRPYNPVSTQTLGNDPFTTVSGSSLVTVVDTAHPLTQDSKITIAGATAVGGLTLNGTFPVTTITDANTFVIDTSTAATSGATGGGASVTYTGMALASGSPTTWGIWDEAVKFDMAFDTARIMAMLYYQQPAPLSVSNPSNFLTIKYPNLLLVGCMTAAAKFMRDDGEYKKLLAELQSMTQQVAIVDDFSYRGASFGTETP
jgi:hypothetical protein